MTQKKSFPPVKSGLHPRNLHRERYDFPALIAAHPALSAFVHTNPHGDASVDFANPAAVKALNAALLAHFYGIQNWDIPPGYLCPPIPGRADYLHQLADLLAICNRGNIPRGPHVRGLDVGCGANAIYPMLGHTLYDWSFVGTEIDPVALKNAEKIFASNANLTSALEMRLQEHPDDILAGAINSNEYFEFTLCNPPFHASAEEAAAGSQRKLRNIGKEVTAKPRLNFEGLSHELWCEGGEREFIRHMISQSRPLADNILWFSTLVSKQDNLPQIYAQIERIGARNMRTLDMAQGQKISRAVAWSFYRTADMEKWARSRWKA
ncbi:23S rRNA (adenine(1618)-N(6))-methyltransferase RlmF [Uliginosibacterium sp. 31-16]|uniref:23S rRNA (adenine(1618)-N(6))-methyltransferase RlmF n=1 Tax=Uliginosibacterium sp. 31-16 TaxID=3068315 RepID=UPI00273DC9FE|nr:23S rRNA (adenine(1618)-N(6))-methyltransferase RlmF [Uliginosibacterium sp. 31-16]MDP5238121.1 23S rRNA (adenine(1618)-N(6))-methyltransferase RlmF [Uliginosibacterium sp. 31-16]